MICNNVSRAISSYAQKQDKNFFQMQYDLNSTQARLESLGRKAAGAEDVTDQTEDTQESIFQETTKLERTNIRN